MRDEGRRQSSPASQLLFPLILNSAFSAFLLFLLLLLLLLTENSFLLKWQQASNATNMLLNAVNYASHSLFRFVAPRQQ